MIFSESEKQKVFQDYIVNRLLSDTPYGTSRPMHALCVTRDGHSVLTKFDQGG